MLLHSVAFAQSGDSASDSGSSFAGEFVIESANNSEDPLHIHFQYGRAPELSSDDPRAISEVSKNIEAFQAAIQGEEGSVYYVPEGSSSSNLPVEIVERVHPKTVLVPKNLVQSFKEAFRSSYVAPTATEKTMGVVFGVVRGGISGMVWFAAPGVSPELATLMTLAIGTTSGFNNMYNQTLNNLFAYGLKNRRTLIGKAQRGATLTSRSMGYDYIFANLFNLLSGMRNTFGQLSTNFLVTGILGNVVYAQKNTMLQGRRQLNISYTLLLAPFMYSLQALDATGAVHGLFDIGFYEVRATLLATLAIYSTVFIANAYAKEKVIRILEVVDRRVTRLINKIELRFTRSSGDECDLVLGGDSIKERVSP